MIERDLQRGVAAHRQTDDMRTFYFEMIEHGDGVAHHVLVAVGVARRRHVGRRIAARGIGDAAVALAEFAELRLPAAMVAGEFVHEQDRRALPRFFVMEPHIVGCERVRHGWPVPVQAGGTLYGDCACLEAAAVNRGCGAPSRY